MKVDWAGAIENKDLAKIWIGGEEFTGIGYQGLMTVNTKTYVEEPTRANDGSIPNIDDHDTFVVPRCKVNFKFFNIRDYQRLCRVVNSANQFPVKFFDKQFGEFREYMMYAEPEEMAKMFNVGTSVIGLLDYEVSFIGTLNNLEKFNVTYRPIFFDGTTLVDLTPKAIDYSDTATYYKGQMVYWNGGYYEAIYYDDTFSGQTPPNNKYWEIAFPTLWNEVITYSAGDFVYVETTTGGETTRKYYQAKKDNFYGFAVTNKEYWNEITVSEYSNEKTYTRGNYTYVKDTGVYYKAIYYQETFSGVSPNNDKYWGKISKPINVDKQVNWGNSIKVLSGSTLSDFYEIPSGKVFKEWNTRADGYGLRLLAGSNWSVFEDTSIYPIFIDEV